MIQLPVVKTHLLIILVYPAVFVDNPGCKIIKHLTAPDLFRPQHRHSVRQLPGSHLHEHLKVLSCKYHIHVVVPWNKALMTYRSQKGARIHHIVDFILPADAVNFL